MSVALLPGQAGRDAVPETQAAARTASREARWPRLVAHLDGDVLQAAIERGDRRLHHVWRLAVPMADGLAASLQAYVASTGQAPVAGAIVVDGAVAAGRFQPRRGARAVGIESLRIDLGLRTLRVLDERSVLHQSTGVPTSASVRWVLAPRVTPARGAVSTAVCRLGADARAAMLAPAGGANPALPLALMSHPFAPVEPDELIVVASMRARGMAPVFGNLLGTDGISRAFEALAGIDYDHACPLSAEGVVSLVARDERARRACAVICAAIAQLCALLSFDGVRRVLLAGRAAALLAPQLARFPIAGRLGCVRADAAEAATEMEVGVLFAPIRFLEGARAALDQAMRAQSPAAAQTLVERIGERYAQLTPSSRRVADLVLGTPALVTRESIVAIAAAAGVSPSQVSRFCRLLGFGGLVDFKLKLAASLADASA
jgi:glucokinase